MTDNNEDFKCHLRIENVGFEIYDDAKIATPVYMVIATNGDVSVKIPWELYSKMFMQWAQTMEQANVECSTVEDFIEKVKFEK